MAAYLEAQHALERVRLVRRIINRLATLPEEAIRDFTLVQMAMLDVVRDDLAPEALLLAEALLEMSPDEPKD